VALSRYYGSDPELVLAGGGNTSLKIEQLLWVKASGHALATITPEGFVEMQRPDLEALLGMELEQDRHRREELFKEAIMAARVHPQKGQRPSVEVVFHHLIPRRFVVHTHATLANMLCCAKGGRELSRKLLGDQVVWIPEVDPGLPLAQTIRDALLDYARKTQRDCPRAILMQNHGLIVAGDNPDEVRQNTDWVLDTLRQHMAGITQGPAFGPLSHIQPDKAQTLVQTMGPALRGLLAGDEHLRVVLFDDSPTVMELVGGRDGAAVARGGPLTPDQIVYCKAMPLWLEEPEGADATALLEQWRQVVKAHRAETKFAPQIVLVRGLGMFAAGEDYKSADTARQVYIDAIKVMAGARRLGQINYLSQAQREFFEYWEVEAYRRRIAKGGQRPGRASGKVALVTGAAQGFGLEIAQDLVAQGGHVLLADLNVEGAAKAAADLCARHGAGRAIGVGLNVIDSATIEAAVRLAIRTYGGLDLLISNAGVLKAGSVKTQPEKDFEFVTAVNYKGYFLCVQKVAPVMAIQHLARPDSWSDIIQINSKSGLEGSNRNGAYAGSKFGGIGLTQSFALELVEDGIKVNAICPGNFFDGPLWSDPQQGLFVQYLRSGKVPGAKTIEDVRRFYEAKVPMGRGCTAADVMKAVYYLMEQKYETGQAMPVTGGQVMLS
jgi:rhamnose utilization protein RhaD (predicted bifunctional aldolase and dehydrogenase)/NAD(P)-dependent dehydrogenase (short-subunit alcohol dehydrogenase family)